MILTPQAIPLSTRRMLLGATTLFSNAPFAERLKGLDKPTVWHEFSPLAAQYNSVNLGQGFPDWDPPEFVQQAMVRSVIPKYGRKANQYARSYAHLPLARILAEEYTQKLNQEIDPTSQVATAVGATNVLYCALQGLVSPGDEVILFEPAFDIYASQVKMAGGIPRYVPLKPSGDPSKGANAFFQLDVQDLKSAITDKTKLIIFNSPHNPTGKMFTRSEQIEISNVIADHPKIIVISDEVYEHIVFEKDEPHVSFANIDGMFDRTLTMSSAGKTFSCTGWKVGWAIGPKDLVKAVIGAQQWVNFSAPTPQQDAIAQCLELARAPYEGYPTYYDHLSALYRQKRNRLSSILAQANITPVMPPGGFFIMADTSLISFPKSYENEVTEAMPCTPMPRDWALNRWLTQEIGVTAIPPSAFYCDGNIPLARNLLRFAFCKSDETLDEAGKRLLKLTSTSNR